MCNSSWIRSWSISFEIPQGSCLGPVLFSLYLLHLGFICKKQIGPSHSCVNDPRLYLHMNCNDNSKLMSMLDCLDDIKVWVATNFLQLRLNVK